MTAPLAPLAERFRFNHTLLHSATEGLPPEAWSRAPDGGGNSGHWILGHITAARRLLLRMAGADVPAEPWEDAFGRGVKPAAPDAYAPVEELVAVFQGAGEAIAECFGALSEADLECPIQRPFPDGSETLRGAAHFLYMHEVYHLGQLGYIRRLAGLPGFA